MSRVVLYPTQVRLTARNKAHDVCRPLARQVQDAGKAMAPRGSRTHGSGRTDSRPSLASSWFIRGSETARYVTYEVGNTAIHAMTVAVGSQPHDIRARGSKPMAFYSERFALIRRARGRTPRALFFAWKVRHPGNKRPVRYLQTPLASYGRRAGFKVTNLISTRSRLP